MNHRTAFVFAVQQLGRRITGNVFFNGGNMPAPARADTKAAAERKAQLARQAKAAKRTKAKKRRDRIKEQVKADRTRTFGKDRPSDMADFGAWAFGMRRRFRKYGGRRAKATRKSLDWIRCWIYRYGRKVDRGDLLDDLRLYVQERDGAQRWKGGSNPFYWVLALVEDGETFERTSRGPLARSLLKANDLSIHPKLLIPALRLFPDMERPKDEFYRRMFDEIVRKSRTKSRAPQASKTHAAESAPAKAST